MDGFCRKERGSAQKEYGEMQVKDGEKHIFILLIMHIPMYFSYLFHENVLLCSVDKAFDPQFPVLVLSSQ